MVQSANGRRVDLFIKLKNNMELTSKQKGNLTELQCITYLYKLGYQCSIPYGENSRYDLIADIDGILIRIQVKTCTFKNNEENVIKFSCRSSRINAQGAVNRRYTSEEIDYFATFYNGICYLIPQSECSTSKTLRFTPPKSGVTKGISFAKDYEASIQINKIKEKNN